MGVGALWDWQERMLKARDGEEFHETLSSRYVPVISILRTQQQWTSALLHPITGGGGGCLGGGEGGIASSMVQSLVEYLERSSKGKEGE